MIEHRDSGSYKATAREHLITTILNEAGTAMTSNTLGRWPEHGYVEPGSISQFSRLLTPAGKQELIRGGYHQVSFIPQEDIFRAHGVTEVVKTVATQSESSLDNEANSGIRIGREGMIDIQPMLQSEAVYGGRDEPALAVHYFTLPQAELSETTFGSPQVIVSFVLPERIANAFTSQVDPEFMQELIDRTATHPKQFGITQEEWNRTTEADDVPHRPHFEAMGERRLYVDSSARVVRVWKFEPDKIVGFQREEDADDDNDEPVLGQSSQASIGEQEKQLPQQHSSWKLFHRKTK